MILLQLDPLLLALLALLVVVAPLWGRRGLANLRGALSRGDTAARLREYRRTTFSEWTIAGVLVALWVLLGRDWETVSLVPRASGWQWVAILGSMAVTCVFAVQSARAATDPAGLRKLRSGLGPLKDFLPHTKEELNGFYLLSITAGVCEEIVYRGFLMGLLAVEFGTWPAVALSSLVFGLGHSYQGAGGIVRTGAIGLALALMVVLTGSLFAAMIAHAVLDFAQGPMLFAAVNLEDDPCDLSPTQEETCSLP